MQTRRSRGFTIIELLVSVVILGVISGAAIKLMITQNRYYDHETNIRAARSVARNAGNVLMSDLRMVQDSGGIDSVLFNGKLVRVLVPYRYGLVCGTTGNSTTVSMLPTDSATIAMSAYRGFAYRGTTGRYTYVWPANPGTSDVPVTATTPALCTGSGSGQAQIRTVSANGRTGSLLDLPYSAPSGAVQGNPVFFWQRVTYSFATSATYPNRLALWRNVEGGRNEELLAPFDTSARFRFYVAGDDTSRLAPPPLANIRGLDIVLSATSPRGTSRDSVSKQLGIVTSIFFKNVRSF